MGAIERLDQGPLIGPSWGSADHFCQAVPTEASTRTRSRGGRRAAGECNAGVLSPAASLRLAREASTCVTARIDLERQAPNCSHSGGIYLPINRPTPVTNTRKLGDGGASR